MGNSLKRLFSLILAFAIGLTLCACDWGITNCNSCDRSIALNSEFCPYCGNASEFNYVHNDSDSIIGVWNNSNVFGTFTYIFYDDGLFHGIYYGNYANTLPTLSDSEYSYYGNGGGYWSVKGGNIEITYNNYELTHIYEYEFNEDLSEMTLTLKNLDDSATDDAQSTLWHKSESGHPKTEFLIRNPNGVVSVDETNVISAKESSDEVYGYAVQIRFDGDGAYSLSRDTAYYAGHEFLVNLDGVWIAKATISDAITNGAVMITFPTEYEMKILVRRLENTIS